MENCCQHWKDIEFVNQQTNDRRTEKIDRARNRKKAVIAAAIADAARTMIW